MPEFAPVINVSTLNGTNGFRLDGAAASDRLGEAVGGGGDFNGDGLADLLIGAPQASLLGASVGTAYVVFSSPSNPAGQKIGDRVAAGSAYLFAAEGVGDRLGASVHSAGDVNGDGIDDLIIGAPFADPDAAGGNRGAGYLVFGGAANLEALDNATLNDNLISLASLTAAAGYRFDGGANIDNAGWSVSGAGDVNGDGIGDLLIGAPAADPNSGAANGREGATYLVFGGTANLTALDAADGAADGRINLVNIGAGQGLRIDGSSVFFDDYSGRSVALAGDVNGDGFDDLLVGALRADTNGVDVNEGAAYLVFGRPGELFTLATLDLQVPNGLETARFDGTEAGDSAGNSVNGLGDVNGDGFADIVIGAYGVNTSGIDSGAAYVVFGKSGFAASSDLSALNGANGFRLDGLRSLDYTGASVSAAGDVNGDGFDDILVGASGFNRLGANAAGAAYVVFGKAAGFAAAIDLGSLDGDTGFRIEGAAGLDRLGASVAAAGDVNGDGFDDMIVGAHFADNNSLNNSGSTYIIYGHRAETAVTRVGTALDNTINGGKGADTISGFSGNDKLSGWEDDDHIDGGDGNDTIDGGDGDDTIVAAGGNDAITGGEGTDLISAGSGADQIICSIGGDDDITGGSGKDTMDFRPFGASPINVDMALGRAVLSIGDIMTFREIEQIRATTGNDTILGDDRNNSLLEGNTGNDVINGRGGADFIAGNGGKDTMTGGTGVDRFDFNLTTDSTTSAATRDIITDFKLGGELDKIDLGTIDAIAGGGTSNDTFTFVTGAFTAAGQVRAVQSGADTIIELNTSGTSGAEMTILLTGVTATTITGADFFL